MMSNLKIPVAGIKEQREQTSRTYKIDWENGRIIGAVDGIEAVRQAIHKVLLTPRFACGIYDNQYGSELHALLRKDGVTRELIRTETPRIVKDALLPDTRIHDVSDIQISFDGDEAHLSFVASTIYGDTVIEEVLKIA